MTPGIISSPVVFGQLQELPVNPTPVAIESIYSAPVDSGDTGTLTLSLGDDFLGRFFLISWAATRGATTGSPSSIFLEVNGENHSLEAVSGNNFGFVYQAFVFVSGTSMTIKSTIVNATINRFNVWKIGTEDAPGQIVAESGVSEFTASSVSVPLRSSTLTRDTQIIAVTGARPQSSGNTFVESWLINQNTDQENHRSEDSRIQYSKGIVPVGISSFTLPDSSPSSLRKAGNYYQIRRLPAFASPVDYSYENLKYRFNAEDGCFRDIDGIIPCYNGDRVAYWRNTGLLSNAKQTVRSRRPIFNTGGANGYPYIECNRDDKHYFENLLDLGQNSGFTGWNPLTVTMVVQFYDLDSSNPILGDGENSYKGSIILATNGNLRVHKLITTTITPPIDEVVVITARIRNNTNIDFMMNGVFSSANGSGNSPPPGQTETQFLRSTGTFGEVYFNGRLYEIMIHHDDPALEIYDYESSHRYLMQKYGITLPF
jgi:hypothetical protein